jgi:tetratricopeptide (TPR) repeat protein
LYSIAKKEKNVEKVNNYYEKIKELNLNKGFLQGRLGLIELDRKDYLKAEQYFRKAVSFNEADGIWLSYLGIAVCEQDRLYEGLSYLRRSEELNPKNPFVQHNLGVAYKKLGQLEIAIVHFGNALSMDPANTEYLERFRGALQERKAILKKASELEGRLKNQPEDADGFFELAMINSMLQQPEKELMSLEASVQARPDFQKGLVQLGIAYAKRGRYGDALSVFQKLSNMEPNESQWDYKIATVQSRMGDATAACASLRRAIEKGYSDDDKIKTDLNFDPIRENDCFRSIVGQ